jgi:hypothetical protein
LLLKLGRMSGALRQPIGIVRVAFITAALLAAPAATHYPQAVAAKPLVQHGKALAEGTLKDGPKHTWDAIKKKPVRYGGMLLGLGSLGAGAKWLGLNPEPLLVPRTAATRGFWF